MPSSPRQLDFRGPAIADRGKIWIERFEHLLASSRRTKCLLSGAKAFCCPGPMHRKLCACRRRSTPTRRTPKSGKLQRRTSIRVRKRRHLSISTLCSAVARQFHRTHGFFIDGVDENTAKLPKGWHRRAFVRRIDVDGRIVLAVAPCPEDLIVSKLARLDPKDKAFIEAYHAERPLDLDVVEERICAKAVSSRRWPREQSGISVRSRANTMAPAVVLAAGPVKAL